MRRQLAVLISLLMLLIPAYGLPAIALAAGDGTAACSDGPLAVNRWDGVTWSDSAAKQGASGTIEAGLELNNCHPTRDTPEISGSFAFSNVIPPGGQFNSIAQIGVGNCRSPFQCSGGLHYYSGWGRSSATPGCSGWSNRAPFATELSQSYDNLHTHDLKVVHTAGYWAFLSGSTLLQEITDNNICWTGKSAQWFGETWDAGDANGGPQNDSAEFSSMNYSNTVGGGFFYTNFNPSSNCNFVLPNGLTSYRCDIISATAYLWWTAR
jgi:hypothetical protein